MTKDKFRRIDLVFSMLHHRDAVAVIFHGNTEDSISILADCDMDMLDGDASLLRVGTDQGITSIDENLIVEFIEARVERDTPMDHLRSTGV